MEITMAIFNEMINVCRAYDPYTSYIDSYTQEQQAIERNKRIDQKFNELLKPYWNGYSGGVPEN